MPHTHKLEDLPHKSHRLPEGMRYRVSHQRIMDYPDAPAYATDEEIKPFAKQNGGTTVVEIGRIVEKEGGLKEFVPEISASAVCSIRDQYDRKRGRDIALGRALLMLTNPAEVERRQEQREIRLRDAADTGERLSLEKLIEKLGLNPTDFGLDK